MTSLKITPNFEKKTAKFEGTIAGGERVRVEISDVNAYIGGLNSLRLRAVGSQGETLAQFPFENSKDTWVQENGKIICELNLNTDKLLEAVPPASRAMILFVLDDGGNEVLYFKSFYAVDHWPRKVGEEEPVDLGGYADFVKDATESIASAEAAIEKASKNAMNASENAEEAAKNAKEAVATAKKIESSLSTKADKTALADEVARATQSEAQIDGKINTIIADDAGKSARTIAAEEVAKVVADAPADFDTLKEIAEYIESDKTGAAQMVTKIDANANAISAEAQRAQDAEAALRQAVEGKVDVVEGKGLSANDYTDAEKSKLAGIAAGAQVNPTPIAPVNATESGMFADAYWTKQDLAGKADKVAYAIDGNLAAIDSNGNLTDSGMALRDFAVAESLAPVFVAGNAYEVGDLCTSFDNGEQHKGAWLYKCILATDGSQPTSPEIDPTHWALATVGDLLAALRQAVEGKVDVVEGKGLSTNDYTNEDKAKLGKAYTPDNPPPAPDLSGYATKDAALPRYYFTILEVVGGVLTVPPYTSACIPGSPETAFTIAVGEGNSMYLRDCILCVVCGDVAPTITWPANFHPRTDAVTDFACVAGAMNVYWISEYAQGEFAVAGWQATAGGSAV